MEYGHLQLNRLTAELGPKLDETAVGKVTLLPDVAAQVELCDNTLIVEFAEGADIAAGETLTVRSASPQQQ